MGWDEMGWERVGWDGMGWSPATAGVPPQKDGPYCCCCCPATDYVRTTRAVFLRYGVQGGSKLISLLACDISSLTTYIYDSTVSRGGAPCVLVWGGTTKNETSKKFGHGGIANGNSRRFLSVGPKALQNNSLCCSSTRSLATRENPVTVVVP